VKSKHPLQAFWHGIQGSFPQTRIVTFVVDFVMEIM